MKMNPEEMVEELRVATGVDLPEDLVDPEDKWMYLMGRVAGAVQVAGRKGGRAPDKKNGDR